MEASTSESTKPTACFCSYCGAKLDENARFCKSCGEPVVQMQQPFNNTSFDEGSKAEDKSTKPEPVKEDPQTRETVYEGYIHKCPNCGEVITSFVANCPSCGYELRGSSATDSVQKLYLDLKRTTSIEQKALMIRNFPIPNAKEDIIEFMILASTNIGGEPDKSIFEAWCAKFEQVYRKAQMALQNDPSFTRIEEIYQKAEKAIAREKISHSTATAGNMISNVFKTMPNPVFAIVAVMLVIFNLIRLFNGQFAGIDIIFDAIILSIAFKLTEKKTKKNKTESASTTSSSEVEVNIAKVPFSVVGGTSENYVVVETLFTQAGFTNVRTVPLNDLTFGIKNKPGSVDDITINGKELSSYFRRKFDANVPVVITYHSMR